MRLGNRPFFSGKIPLLPHSVYINKKQKIALDINSNDIKGLKRRCLSIKKDNGRVIDRGLNVSNFFHSTLKF